MYVEDLDIIGNDKLFMASVINKLGAQSSSKDMGSFHFFLGVKVIPTPRSLFLSQTQIYS